MSTMFKIDLSKRGVNYTCLFDIDSYDVTDDERNIRVDHDKNTTIHKCLDSLIGKQYIIEDIQSG